MTAGRALVYIMRMGLAHARENEGALKCDYNKLTSDIRNFSKCDADGRKSLEIVVQALRFNQSKGLGTDFIPLLTYIIKYPDIPSETISWWASWLHDDNEETKKAKQIWSCIQSITGTR